MNIKTTEQLCDYIATTYPDQISEGEGPLDAAVWFCCIQEAKNLSGLNLKELASVIQHGMVSYTDDAMNAVQHWLEEYNEMVADCISEDEEYISLEDLIKDFYENPQ